MVDSIRVGGPKDFIPNLLQITWFYAAIINDNDNDKVGFSGEVSDESLS